MVIDRPQSATFRKKENIDRLQSENKFSPKHSFQYIGYKGVFDRLVPNQVPCDKEQLYCQLTQLKAVNNGLFAENKILKTRIAALQKQFSRKSDLQGKLTDKFHSKLVVQELTQQVQKLQSQNLRLKRLVKYTRIRERETQRLEAAEELIRLKNIIASKQADKGIDSARQQIIQQLSKQLKRKTFQCQRLTQLKSKLEISKVPRKAQPSLKSGQMMIVNKESSAQTGNRPKSSCKRGKQSTKAPRYSAIGNEEDQSVPNVIQDELQY